ncbi:MAG: hypothetical protein GY950_31240 [bacterium]|nr:hypothetical protein [bacterium]
MKRGKGKLPSGMVSTPEISRPPPENGNEKNISKQFSFKPGEEKILDITLKDGENGSANDSWFGLPAMFNYEFFPEAEEDKKENIEIVQEGRQKFLKIPKGSPLNWKLKVRKTEAPLSSLTGTEDTVKPGGGKDGEKSLPRPDDFKDRVDLKNAETLGDFLENDIKADVFTAEDREKIIEQAITLLDGVYVHLTFKKTRHAVAPIQSLKNLRKDAVEPTKDEYGNIAKNEKGEAKLKLDDRAFHSRMISIFTGLRDLHTHYVLPHPYKNKVAFLPFLIEDYYEGGQRKYMVSKVFSGTKDVAPGFKEGVDITHWNGIPMERAVELNGEQTAGSNEYARRARGLEYMTIRSLKMALPPDEEWVDITFKNDGQERNLRFNWYVADHPTSDKSGIDPAPLPDPLMSNPWAKEVKTRNQADPDIDKMKAALGINVKTEISRRMKKALFLGSQNGSSLGDQKGTNGNDRQVHAPITLERSDTMGDIFAFGITNGNMNEKNWKNEGYGYIRIYSFDVKDADAFVEEFISIVRDKLPQNGLIIDVRGNGGGLITAGEKLLQVFTDKKIERVLFEFRSGSLMEELCRKNNFLSEWADPIDLATSTGAPHSKGFPLETDDEFKIDIENGYRYIGNVVLITDALCYSTTDIFAAGFVDNNFGKILGTDQTTGGGGANVWTHEFLANLPGAPIDKAPSEDDRKAYEFKVAVRRAVRVGENRDIPLEDLGVTTKYVHHMTKRDILEGNVDLIYEAVNMLDNWENTPA